MKKREIALLYLTRKAQEWRAWELSEEGKESSWANKKEEFISVLQMCMRGEKKLKFIIKI